MVIVRKRFVRSLPSFRENLLVVIAGNEGRSTENRSPLTVYRRQRLGKRDGPIATSGSWHTAPLTSTIGTISNKRIRFISYTPAYPFVPPVFVMFGWVPQRLGYRLFSVPQCPYNTSHAGRT